MDEFKGSPNSKKLYLLHYYDISKQDVYAFLLDMCQTRDWLFAMSILMDGNVSHYFSTPEHFEKKTFELTNNQFIKDAIICVRDLAMPN